VLEEKQVEDPKVYDITIVGGGPAGLFGAFYAGMRQMSTKIIDALPQLGGQLTALYPEKFIYDMPGFPKVRASELVQRLVEQAMQFNPTVCLNEVALKLERLDEKLFRLTTNKALHYSRTVLLCVGIGAFSPRRLGRPEVERFEGRGVYYTVTDLNAFAGKKVLIVGGRRQCCRLGAHLRTHRGKGSAHPPPRPIPRPRAQRGATKALFGGSALVPRIGDRDGKGAS